jgi:hypothetical protein
VKKHLLISLCIIAATFPITVNYAAAGSMETLMMPGKVIQGHAKYEEKCNSCHQPFSKEKQSTLCRDCHKEVDADIMSRHGLHGRAETRETECSHCHTDHIGRDADVIQLDRETFDHSTTDYSLRGAHTIVRCKGCHIREKEYRGTASTCVSCHEKDDIHKGILGEECTDCHTERAWRRPDFDHDKTDFALREKHAELDCNSCHVNQVYKDTTQQCHGCHLLNDVHAGRYGEQCSDCHSEKDWGKTHFDHRRDTSYPLQGRHRSTKCDACHNGNLYKEKLNTKCNSCHRNDDEHSGRYGKQCGSCHTPADWKEAKFDHTGKTDFQLRGKHDEVSCTACHKGDAHNEKLETNCYSCHAADDVHKGEEGQQCQQCHDEQNWGGKIRFDHDMASFPLIGMHAVVPCEECHINAEFKTATNDCNDCHHPEDVHEQRLGLNCESCHNPNGWSLWEFDHDSLTEFPLDGAHAGIDCLSCHETEATDGIEQSSWCADCHRKDDVHDGEFGRNCERCHNAKSFDAVLIR